MSSIHNHKFFSRLHFTRSQKASSYHFIDSLGGGLAYDEPEAHGDYFRSDYKIPAHLPFIASQKGLLWAYRMSRDGAIDDVDFSDTSYPQADFPDDFSDMAKGKFRANAPPISRTRGKASVKELLIAFFPSLFPFTRFKEV